MNSLLHRFKVNALLSAALYTLLGLVLLIWPAPSTQLLCTALGVVLTVCGLGDIAVFLRRRDGSLYAGGHLLLGVVLAAVGIWLIARPTLIAVVIPRIIGVLICIHGGGNLKDAATLHRLGASRWMAALVLGLVSLALGAVLVFDPFDAFTTVVRIIGLFLVYDGISDFYVTWQVDRALKRADPRPGDLHDAVDVDFRDAEE